MFVTLAVMVYTVNSVGETRCLILDGSGRAASCATVDGGGERLTRPAWGSVPIFTDQVSPPPQGDAWAAAGVLTCVTAEAARVSGRITSAANRRDFVSAGALHGSPCRACGNDIPLLLLEPIMLQSLPNPNCKRSCPSGSTGLARESCAVSSTWS